jgi:hypothetical protein
MLAYGSPTHIPRTIPYGPANQRIKIDAIVVAGCLFKSLSIDPIGYSSGCRPSSNVGVRIMELQELELPCRHGQWLFAAPSSEPSGRLM